MRRDIKGVLIALAVIIAVAVFTVTCKHIITNKKNQYIEQAK